MGDIVRDYKRMYSSFRKVYTSNLKWGIGLVLIFHWSLFLFFFVKRKNVGMYFKIKAPRMFYAEVMVMMFMVNAFVFMILYSLSGYVLSNAFGKFQAKLWKVVEDSNDDEFASAKFCNVNGELFKEKSDCCRLHLPSPLNMSLFFGFYLCVWVYF